MHTMKTIAFSLAHTQIERTTADFPLIATKLIIYSLDRNRRGQSLAVYIKGIPV